MEPYRVTIECVLRPRQHSKSAGGTGRGRPDGARERRREDRSLGGATDRATGAGGPSDEPRRGRPVHMGGRGPWLRVALGALRSPEREGLLLAIGNPGGGPRLYRLSSAGEERLPALRRTPRIDPPAAGGRRLDSGPRLAGQVQRVAQLRELELRLQPLGVRLRPVDDALQQLGTAVIARVGGHELESRVQLLRHRLAQRHRSQGLEVGLAVPVTEALDQGPGLAQVLHRVGPDVWWPKHRSIAPSAFVPEPTKEAVRPRR